MKLFTEAERTLISRVVKDVKKEPPRSDRVKQLYEECLQQLKQVDIDYWMNVKQIRNYVHNHPDLLEDDCNSEMTSLTAPPILMTFRFVFILSTMIVIGKGL